MDEGSSFGWNRSDLGAKLRSPRVSGLAAGFALSRKQRLADVTSNHEQGTGRALFGVQFHPFLEINHRFQARVRRQLGGYASLARVFLAHPFLVAIQCLSDTFEVDVDNKSQSDKYILKSTSLYSLYDFYLKNNVMCLWA